MVNAGGVSCVISVGAVDYNDQITYFSSVGPSTWTDVEPYNDYPYNPENPTEIGLIRPDVCAPGMNIKSLDYSNDDGYCTMDGTSMATPCVTGTIALMLSKNHELTPEEIDEILERTAVHFSEHKNNDFGSGRIDALAAVNAVSYEGTSESGESPINVFPNPSNDDFTITCDAMRHIEVYSVEGKLIQEARIEGNTYQLKGLKKGIYLLKITTDRCTLYQKAVRL